MRGWGAVGYGATAPHPCAYLTLPTGYRKVATRNDPSDERSATVRDFDGDGRSGYVVPGAVWETASGVKVDPYDPAFASETLADIQQADLSKPAIYLFSNARDGDGIAYAMAEDGTVLGTHWCSHWGYMRHDLHDRSDRKAACEAHYPDGYRVVILGADEVPPPEVLERNKQQGIGAKAAEGES